MRKIVSAAIGVALIGFSLFIVSRMVANKEKNKISFTEKINFVYVDTVKNSDIPIKVTTSGELIAKNKIEIFSEVQGVLNLSKKEFKEGTHYNSGEIILSINSDEHYANLQALKSNFYNSVTAIMADIRLDFPEEYPKWEKYLSSIDINKTLPELPETNSDKEKFFISGKNIFSNYYNVKNQEVKLRKYTITAPFSGVLTEANVTPGTLVRQGQKLGEFINPDIFELSVTVNSEYAELMQIGKSVELFNIEKTKSWQAKLVRINSKVDKNTQSINVFIQVSGEGLKEGMFLDALLSAKSEKDAYEIDRKLLVNDNKLYMVKDSVLELVKINPVYFKNNTVVVKGLKNGSVILKKTIPGAHSGMKVKVMNTPENIKNL